MDKQELQNEIEKARAHLANMEKMLEQCEYERWKPRCGDKYYCITSAGNVVKSINSFNRLRNKH